MNNIVPASYGELFEKGEFIGIESMSVTYIQAADTNSSSDEVQTLTIETQMPCSPTLEDALNEQSYYFNIKTDKWSISNSDELSMLLDDFKKRIYNNHDMYEHLKEKEDDPGKIRES